MSLDYSLKTVVFKTVNELRKFGMGICDKEAVFNTVKRGIKFALPMFVFTGCLMYLQWFSSSDETKNIRDFASEGSKALAWHITSPSCVVNNVCRYIEHDQNMGKLIGVRKADSLIFNSYTTLITESGDVAVDGNIEQLPIGAMVKLFRERNGKQNVACIENACFSVPFEPLN
jgi:hypothetical protein